MFCGIEQIKKFIVVRHIFYDWNLYSCKFISEHDTVEEAQTAIDKLENTNKGLVQTNYIFKREE